MSSTKFHRVPGKRWRDWKMARTRRGRRTWRSASRPPSPTSTSTSSARWRTSKSSNGPRSGFFTGGRTRRESEPFTKWGSTPFPPRTSRTSEPTRQTRLLLLLLLLKFSGWSWRRRPGLTSKSSSTVTSVGQAPTWGRFSVFRIWTSSPSMSW